MQEAGVSLLTRWQNFYVIIGSAAATLTGLMFVATTLLGRARTPAHMLRASFEAFATPTLVQFGVPLLVAAILSAPWQALWLAGLLLGLVGLGAITLIVIAVRWGRRQTDYETKLADWLWYRIVPLVAYVALVVAAIALPGSPAPALFIIGGVTVMLLFIGIRNAWDSITYLAIERSQPEKKSQD
jgi:hypothetical protein